MLKIAMVNAADAGGGAERVSWTLAEALREQGHRVSFLCAEARRPGSRAMLGPCDWVLGRAIKRFGYADALSLAALRFLSYPEVREADVVHFHNLHGFYFGVALLPRIFAAKRCVWTLHDCWPLSGGCYSHLAGELPCDKWRLGCGSCPGHGIHPMTGMFDTAAGMLRLKRDAFRALVANGGVVSGVSEWMAQRARDFLQSAGIDSARVAAVRNRVDLLPAAGTLPVELPAQRPVFLMVAADVNNRMKGMATALSALQRNLDHPFTLLTVGKPFPEAVLERYRLSARTVQLGHLEDRALLARVYAAASLTIVPSLAESFCLVAAESVACGTPVLSSDVAALPELVRPGETGFLARGGDAADFAGKLGHFLRLAAGEREQLRESALSFARREFLSRESWTAAYEELYRHALSQGEGCRRPV